jgi:hypothetical protein
VKFLVRTNRKNSCFGGDTGMTKIVAAFIAASIFLLLLAGCSSPKTVTVTAAPVTVTVTKTLPPVTETVTKTSPPVTVNVTPTSPPVTVTITPTWIPSIYRGSLNVNWSGIRTPGVPISGSSFITIDENGDFHGDFGGAYSGNITGQVDPIGNFVAIGMLSQGGIIIGTTWSARVTLSGKTLSAHGDWTSEEASGNFTGTGTVSY